MYVVDMSGDIMTAKQYWNQSISQSSDLITSNKLPEFKTYFEALVYAKKLLSKKIAYIEKELSNMDLEDDTHNG